MNTEQAEIVATVYAAWNDLILMGKRGSPEEIISEVRQRWHRKKERFSSERLQIAIDWMIEKNLVPKGTGSPTV